LLAAVCTAGLGELEHAAKAVVAKANAKQAIPRSKVGMG
jgi:hypothetical protein